MEEFIGKSYDNKILRRILITIKKKYHKNDIMNISLNLSHDKNDSNKYNLKKIGYINKYNIYDLQSEISLSGERIFIKIENLNGKAKDINYGSVIFADD